VVEAHEDDDVADVVLVRDAACVRPVAVGEQGVVRDAALGQEAGEVFLGEEEVRRAVTVQVPDLTPPDPEGELAAAARTGGHPGPGRDLFGDAAGGVGGAAHGASSVHAGRSQVEGAMGPRTGAPAR